MDPGLSSTLVRIAGFAAGLAAVLIVCRVRRLPLRDTLALRWPGTARAAAWYAGFAVLAVVAELVSRRLGLGEVKPWSFAPAVAALRVFAVVLLAPATEELVFRGLLFSRIRSTRAGTAGAVVITALVFAGVHFQYDAAGMAFVLMDGLFYGLVRARTESTPLTFVMHMSGNLFAVLQRLS